MIDSFAGRGLIAPARPSFASRLLPPPPSTVGGFSPLIPSVAVAVVAVAVVAVAVVAVVVVVLVPGWVNHYNLAANANFYLFSLPRRVK